MISTIYEKPKYRKCRACGTTRNLELAPVCPVCLYGRKGQSDTRKRTIQNGLRFLKARYQNILRFRWGIDSGRERTLEETGRKFGITRERVRQIESAALQEITKDS